MGLREVKFDSLRPAKLRGEWVIILKGEGTEQYVPIYIGSSQADIIKSELMGIEFTEDEMHGHFLANDYMAGSTLESVVIEQSKNDHFNAKLFLTARGECFEMDSPIASAIALAFRRKASILVDDTTFHEVGITLS